jgi:hypothetical protein
MVVHLLHYDTLRLGTPCARLRPHAHPRAQSAAVGMSGSARWLMLPRGSTRGSSIQCCCCLHTHPTALPPHSGDHGVSKLKFLPLIRIVHTNGQSKDKQVLGPLTPWITAPRCCGKPQVAWI